MPSDQSILDDAPDIADFPNKRVRNKRRLKDGTLQMEVEYVCDFQLDFLMLQFQTLEETDNEHAAQNDTANDGRESPPIEGNNNSVIKVIINPRF